MAARTGWMLALGIGIGTALAVSFGCGGDEPAKQATTAAPAKAPAAPSPKLPTEPTPTLLVTQAQFAMVGGKPKPQPAKLSLLHLVDGAFVREDIEDPDANVFHKAMAFDGGILTIGAEAAPKPATLKLWRKADGAWSAQTLWSRAWDGARFNRLRDIEIGDVDGDGQDELVIATHDRGVVAVGNPKADASGWDFVEMDEVADTFVHEIEIGDVDGDGAKEFYATPSERNKASGASQPGEVVRYVKQDDGTYKRELVASYEDSHAKEILVADVDGDGTDELYVVREGHVVKEGGSTKRVDPVRILRYAPGKDGWEGTVVATLDDDQCRFLLAADVDHDGQTELVAAGMKSGLWRLERGEDGQFKTLLIDKDSGGFEHAVHAADLDGDGKTELYVAADSQKAFRRYVWNGTDFDRTEMLPIGPSERSHITWNLQDGTF